MSCLLTAGRQEVCKDSVGGLQGVYFINFESGSFTKNGDGEITWNEAAASIYRLTKEMKSGNRDVWVSTG